MDIEKFQAIINRVAYKNRLEPNKVKSIITHVFKSIRLCIHDMSTYKILIHNFGTFKIKKAKITSRLKLLEKKKSQGLISEEEYLSKKEFLDNILKEIE